MIKGFDEAALAIYAGVTWVPALLALWFGFRPVDRRIDAWAAVRGVRLDSESRKYVVQHLTRARRWRSIGFAAGWLLPLAWLFGTRSAYSRSPINTVVAVVGGYVLGGLLAEVRSWAARPASGAAVFDARPVERYLPANVRRAAWAVAGASVGFGVVYIRLPIPSPGGLAAFAAGTAAIVAAAVAVEAVPRFVVSRPQPFFTAELLQADDALRSWSAQSLAGALLAGALLGIGTQYVELASMTEHRILRLAAFPLQVCSLAGALTVFVRLSDYHGRWQVRRSLSGTSP